jgi:hypothetical protein
VRRKAAAVVLALSVAAGSGTAIAETGAATEAAEETAAEVVAVTGSADVQQNSASDADSAAIVSNGVTEVDVPMSPADPVEISMPAGEIAIGLPGDQGKATEVDGTVVYQDSQSSSDAVVQPTTDGGVRMLVSIADATAPSEYRFPIDMPSGATASLTPDGVVELTSADGASLGSVAPAWAKDATGAAVPTSYRLEGNVLVQHVEFGPTTAFPVVADPWWNPVTWKWRKIGRATASGLKRCGVGAATTTLGLGTGTVVTNVLLNAAGRTMISVAGGPYAYVGTAVGGCVVGLLQ